MRARTQDVIDKVKECLPDVVADKIPAEDLAEKIVTTLIDFTAEKAMKFAVHKIQEQAVKALSDG